MDAGYDVSDYLRIAPRYGTNVDMVELVTAARDRGIRVLLDLVAGHTSDQHPWFLAERQADGPSPDGDRYVWCEDPPLRETAGVAYVRGGSHLVVVNPRRDAASVDIDRVAGARLLLGEGVDRDSSTVRIDGFGFGVWELD